jgi:hypothetical protein
MDNIAVDLGNTVFIRSDKVQYTLTKEEYNYANQILQKGIPLDKTSLIINPHDIVSYLNESNPEAENVVTEVSIMRALKGAGKENFKIIAWGFAFFIMIIGFILAYVVITQDAGSSLGAVAGNAASGVTIT